MKKVCNSCLTILCFLLLLTACRKADTDFTYSPANPRAGQPVSFSPVTSSADKWEWNFGDGSTSTLAMPTKTYKRAGTYTVTLRVDEKDSRRVSKQITILDTVPTFTLQNDSIMHYMHSAKLSALIYNPYNYDMSYDWIFDTTCIAVLGSNTGQEISVCPLVFDTTLTISLSYRSAEGKMSGTVENSFYVENTPAASLLMATADGKLYCQRKYDIAVSVDKSLREKPVNIAPQQLAGKKVTILLTDTACCYIVASDAAKSTFYIYAMDLSSHNLQTVIECDFPINSAMLLDGYIYFTTDDAICRIDTAVRDRKASTSIELLFANSSSLTGWDTSLGIHGIAWCNGIFFAGSGQSLYRFQTEDINSGTAPALLPLFSDGTYNFSHIKADRIQGRLYLYDIAAGLLSVCKLDGTSAQTVTNQTNGAFAINNELDILCYNVQGSGIVSLPLVHSATTLSVLKADTVNTIDNVVALAIDQKER